MVPVLYAVYTNTNNAFGLTNMLACHSSYVDNKDITSLLSIVLYPQQLLAPLAKVGLTICLFHSGASTLQCWCIVI